MRYGSAPSSLFTNAVDSVIGATRDFSTLGPRTRFFPSESSESTPMPNLNDTVPRTDNHNTTTRPSYGFPPPPPASNLVRHSSLPTGFLNQLASSSAAADNGFSITRVIGNYDFNGIGESNINGTGRLDSQHSFTRQLDQSLSRMGTHHQNNADEDVIIRTTSDHDHHINNNVQRNSAYNNNNNMRANWDDSNSTVFSTTVAPSSKRSAKTTFRNDNMESQFQFCMPEAALEMATMENLLYNNSNIPQDSIPCKIRAKRGFATHPRSIAERERRTRISGKLKKLQDLVPNMDKQTSYSDMLDLAVQHIKTLQNQLQKLNKENDSCMCGCKIKISSPENT